jgi:uncharacterized protein (TIGR02246 family)
MKKLFAVAASLLLLFAAPLFADDQTAAPAAAAPAADTAAPAAGSAMKAKKSGGDEAGVKAVFEKFSKAWADGDAKARAALFTYDATLINPFGVVADGRTEIEKVFEDENNTIAKGTTHTFDNFKIHFVLPNFALVDVDGTISGVKTPAGVDAPDVKLHVYGVVVNRGKDWKFFAARPAIYAPVPGSAPAADAAAPAAAPPADAAVSSATPGAAVPAAPPDTTVPAATK